MCLFLTFLNLMMALRIRQQSKRNEAWSRYLRAIWDADKDIIEKQERRLQAICLGRTAAVEIKASVSEKLAERAFSLASSANVALMGIQRALQTRPVQLSRRQQIGNEVGQKKVMEAVGGAGNYSGFDWIYPILSEEERNIVDNALEHEQRYRESNKTDV